MRALTFALVLGAGSTTLFGLTSPGQQLCPEWGETNNSCFPACPSALGTTTDPSPRADLPFLRANGFSARQDERKEVWLFDNYFSPSTILIKAGTTVRWVNKGFHRHTVTSQAGLWDSGPLDRGAEFSFTFDRPGTYPYHCRFHGRQMRGKVIVN
jgi:plastocyanin